ncbi:MAG: DNA cytosine methyltransferase [Mycoplasmatales bacterium]|nr:DNA cytosine methyltransferase [Mycoplasmatales bacterium]
MEWYDLLTYSFPCQDLSSAGKGKGMAKESGTRSGLLWEIERILLGFKKLNNLPKVLLMENVPKIHSKQNIDDFNKWIAVLKNLGYVSTYKDLNAKDFGIPQNRVRTYMVSILDGEVQNETTEQLTLF